MLACGKSHPPTEFGPERRTHRSRFACALRVRCSQMSRAAPESRMVGISRREMVSAGIGASLVLAPRRISAAPSGFPAKNIKFIIPYAPGGGFDTNIRFIAPVLEQNLPGLVNIVPIKVT